MSDSSEKPEPARLAGRWDYLFSALFLYFWLIPVAWVSVASQSMPLAPPYLKYLHSISCLFNNRPAEWSNHYFQVRLSGSEAWIAPAEEDYFRLKPFGHRNRMHQMFRAPGWHGARQMQALAEFVKRRYEELHPDGPRVGAVRFVSVAYQTGEESLARPAGRWEKPPLEQVDPARAAVTSTHVFDGAPSPRDR